MKQNHCTLQSQDKAGNTIKISETQGLKEKRFDVNFTDHKQNEHLEETEPLTLPSGKYDWLLFILKLLLWVLLWAIFIELQFGAVFFAISALLFIYWNTRTNKTNSTTLSAYSVFNPNCERLQGTLTAEQLEQVLLHRRPLT